MNSSESFTDTIIDIKLNQNNLSKQSLILKKINTVKNSNA